MKPSPKDAIESNIQEVKGTVEEEVGQTNPKHEEIARLAHQNWQQRDCPIGTPEEDWFRAEEEIKQHLNEATAATSNRTEPV